MLFSDTIHDTNDYTEASLGEIREKLFSIRTEFRFIEFFNNKIFQIDISNFDYTEMVNTMVGQGMTKLLLRK